MGVTHLLQESRGLIPVLDIDNYCSELSPLQQAKSSGTLNTHLC
jgi:hypothetical protein